MTAPLEFPSLLLREQSKCWEIVGRAIGGGITGVDAAPLVATDGGGLWQLELAGVSLTTAEQVKCWRAVEALADSGATTFVVPDCDSRYAPWAMVDGELQRSLSHIPHSDQILFSDGSGYSQSPIGSWFIRPALLRAVTVDLLMEQAGELSGGEHFSINHATMGWRRYRVAGVNQGGDADEHKIIKIRPPLREAIDMSETVDWQNPRCTMRLATPNAMRLALEQRKFGSPTVRFIETFDVAA